VNAKLAECIEAGKALDTDDREIAALASQEVDTDEQAEIDAAWSAEISNRLDDVLTGRVELLDVDGSHAQLRAELAALHQ